MEPSPSEAAEPDPGRAAALFLLLAMGFFLDRFVFLSQGSVRVHDVFDSEFPRFLNEARLFLAHGGLEWYPHFACGLPAYATHHTPFYPLALAVQVLPAWLVYQALAVGLMAGAGFGMYLLLRRVLAADEPLAWLGGFQFALGTQVATNSIVVSYFTYLFPLFYVLAEPGPGARRPARALAIAALFGLSYPILTVHFAWAHLLLLWLFDQARAPALRPRLARAALLWGGFALSCAAPLVTLLRFVPLAHRDYAPEAAGPLEMVRHMLERLQIHALDRGAESLALPFLFLALLLATRAAPVRRAFLAAALCLLPVALVDSKAVAPIAGTFLVRLDLHHLLRAVPTFYAVLSVTALAALGALPGRQQAAGLMVAALAALAVPFGGAVQIVDGPLRMANLGLVLMAGGWLLARGGAFAHPWRRRAMLALVGVGAMFAVEGTRLIRMVEEREPYRTTVGPFPELEALAPAPGAPPYRAAGWDMQPMVLQLAGLETVDARGPLYFRRYKQLFGALVAPQVQGAESRAAFEKERFQLHLYSPWDREIAGVDLALLGAMNVRYLVGHRRYPRPTGLRLVRELPAEPAPRGWRAPMLGEAAGRRPVYVYELERWLPRVYAPARLRILPGPEAVLAALGSASADDLATTAYLEADEAARAGLAPGAALAPPRPVRPIDYAPDRIEVEVEAGGAGFLLASFNFHSQWEASADGRPLPLVRANHAFVGVALPAGGRQRVVFRFHDPWLPALLLVQVVGLGLVLAAGAGPWP